jgi:phage terminase small subunit
MEGLTEKRRRFVEAYMGQAKGNATEAARIAGYAKPTEEGYRLLRNAQVRAAIDVRVKSDPGVKTREQLQRWWSDRVDDEAFEPRDRLKASELLAKSQGVFIDRHEVKHEGATVQVYLPDNGRDG